MGPELLLALKVGGTILGTVGALTQASANAAQQEYTAKLEDQAAGQDRAISQRKAAEEARAARIRQSRAIAVAAASGGGATDPTVVNLVSGLAEQGAYRKQVALYEGEESARGHEQAADIARYQAKNAKSTGFLNAATTLIGGAAGAADSWNKYNPGSVGEGFSDYGSTGVSTGYDYSSFSGSSNYDFGIKL